MNTLKPKSWLNDEVINAYLILLNETHAKNQKIKILNTFAYTNFILLNKDMVRFNSR
jgi:Ulp1 family protease